MVFVREDIYARMQQVDSPDHLHASLLAAARGLGFDLCCYGLRLPVPVSNRPIHLLDGYPPGWMQHYRSAGYFELDPVIRQAAHRIEALVWDDQLFCEATELWRDAHDFGLRHGMSQAAWSAQGTFGVLSVARGKGAITPTEASHLAEPLVWLANLTHTAMIRLFAPRQRGGATELLTLREQQVLRWVGEGKTAAEIGQILAISPRTVNFHIYNTLDKLSATNKMQAVVKAFALGLVA